MKRHKNIESNDVCLVVDDCNDAREAVRQVVSVIGFDVISATSGEDAIELMKEARPAINLAILDMQMPGLNGIETLCKIRETLPELPAVLISGRDRSYFQIELEGLMDFVFLKKPFRFTCLEKALRDLGRVS